jgi:hypothetical protein
MRDPGEDPGLAEVKAVLRKLQRLEVPQEIDAHPDGLAKAQPTTKSKKARKEGIDVFERKRRAMVTRVQAAKLAKSRAVIAGAALLLITVVGATAVRLVFVNPPAPKGDEQAINALRAASDKQVPPATLGEVRRLLSGGAVAEARALLLRSKPEDQADVALALAQSFDPNYLRILPDPDSPPSKVEAEKWYRTWYELAVKSGLAMDEERLKRIINAMQ